MPIDLPVGPGRRVAVRRAPIADRLMRLAQAVVGAQVRGRGDRAGRERRADHFAVAGEGRLQLDADLEVDLAVQIDGDVAAGALDLLGADDVPYEATGVRDD